METLITLSDGKKEFSFKVVGIDPKEFRQKMIDFVEIDVNILLSLPKEKEGGEIEFFYFQEHKLVQDPVNKKVSLRFNTSKKANYTIELDEKMIKAERETGFLQSTQFCGLTKSQLEDWFCRHGSKLEFQND